MRERAGPAVRSGRYGAAGRRGIGALIIIVLILVLVVAVMGISQSFFSSHMLDKAARSSYGNVALALAESAIQEVLFALQYEVNRPGNPRFQAFRDPTAGYGDIGFVILRATGADPGLPLQATRRLLERPAFSSYAIDELLCEVSFRRPMNGLAYETGGLLRLMARVSSDRIGSVVRGVELYKDFKVQLVGPPRPFDQVSLFVFDPTSLLGSDVAEANQRLFDSYAALEDILKKKLDALKQLAENAGSYADQARPRIEQAIQDVQPWVPQDIRQPPGDEAQFAHYFNDPVLLLSTQDVEDLSKLSLGNPLREHREKIRQAVDAYDVKAKELEQFASGLGGAGEVDTGRANQLVTETVEALMVLAREHRARVETFMRFQATFFEKSGQAYEKWRDDFLRKLDQPYWRQKATFELSSQKAFDDLRTRLGGKVNGVLFCNGKIKISGPWRGKAAVVATDDVTLENVALGDKTRDALTVIGYKAIQIEGPACDAAIVASAASDVVVADGTKIHGELVFAGDVRRPSELRGKLERNRHLFSGNSEDPSTKLDYFVVSISPQLRLKGVDRQ